MRADRTRMLRGALAGAVAAGTWALQQPLDQRVFQVPYDDAVLLGRLALRERTPRAAASVGLVLHVANGAAAGALYARVAPRLPVPPALRGPLAALTEHLATWPGTAFLRLVHPAPAELPRLWGSSRAFAQATWRHLLFGVVLGELERRLNPPPGDQAPVDPLAAASNGHGSAAHLVVSG
jgi:hypothetical protein